MRRIITVEIGGAAAVKHALVAQSGLRQRTIYAVKASAEFASFLVEEADHNYSYRDNSDAVLHDNTASGFGSWASEQAGAPLRLVAVDRRFKTVWPASPNIASGWAKYSLGAAGGAATAVLFRAAESRDDMWARRLAELPGGPSQRGTELYAVAATSAKLIVPFPLVIPPIEAGQPLTQKFISSDPEPSWASAISVLGQSSLTYACQTRWTELVMSTGAPSFVAGQTGSTEWEECVPPFNSVGPVGVVQLAIVNTSGSESLEYRFGPGTYVQGTVAPSTTVEVSIPAGGSIRFGRESRLQLRSSSPAVAYRVRYELA